MSWILSSSLVQLPITTCVNMDWGWGGFAVTMHSQCLWIPKRSTTSVCHMGSEEVIWIPLCRGLRTASVSQIRAYPAGCCMAHNEDHAHGSVPPSRLQGSDFVCLCRPGSPNSHNCLGLETCLNIRQYPWPGQGVGISVHCYRLFIDEQLIRHFRQCT